MTITLSTPARSVQGVRKRLLSAARRLCKFSLVGASGSVINFALFWLLTTRFGAHYLLASAASFEVAMFGNYFLNNNWTFADRRAGSFSLRALASYQLIAVGSLGLNLVLVQLLIGTIGLNPLLANAFAIACGSVLTFSLNLFWTWRTDGSSSLRGHSIELSLMTHVDNARLAHPRVIYDT